MIIIRSGARRARALYILCFRKEIRVSDIRSIEQQKFSYSEKVGYLCTVLGTDTVSTYEFYRNIFPLGFLQDSYKSNPDAPHDGKYVGIANAIHLRKRDGEFYRKNSYVTDDLKTLLRLNSSVAFISPCSFLGGKKDLEHLRFIHALVVDLDYVDIQQLKDLIHQCTIGYLPTPTYVVNSGTGLHLYYVFEQPIRCYPNEQPAYSKLKHALIDLCWNQYTSLSKQRQYSGLVQPYRIVGSRSKLDVDSNQKVISQTYTVLAWQYGEKWTIEKFLAFEPSIDALQHWRKDMSEFELLLHPELDPNHLTLSKAKELYPDWYDRRILHREPPKSLDEYKWHLNRAVYDNWLERIREEAVEGHRYHCIMCLAIYALKCSTYDKKKNPNPVKWYELLHDAYSLLETFDNLTTDETNHFTISDIDQALKAFKQQNYHRFTTKQVTYFSGIKIKKARRNGRKQKVHLEIARGIKELKLKVGEDVKDGRPKGSLNKNHPKKDLILSYKKEHPNATHSEIARELNISRPTVIKWLKMENESAKICVTNV